MGGVDCSDVVVRGEWYNLPFMGSLTASTDRTPGLGRERPTVLSLQNFPQANRKSTPPIFPDAKALNSHERRVLGVPITEVNLFVIPILKSRPPVGSVVAVFNGFCAGRNCIEVFSVQRQMKDRMLSPDELWVISFRHAI